MSVVICHRSKSPRQSFSFLHLIRKFDLIPSYGRYDIFMLYVKFSHQTFFQHNDGFFSVRSTHFSFSAYLILYHCIIAPLAALSFPLRLLFEG